jgi:hypothetical protein
VTGYGPDQESLVMEDDLPSLKPDLIIVAIYSGTDFGDLLRNKLYRLDGQSRLVPGHPTLSGDLQNDFEAAHITEFNVLLGDRILAGNSAMRLPASEVRLRLAERIVETPRRAGVGWDEGMGNYLKAANGEAGVIHLPVRFLIINDDLALWAAPVELFCEISMDVRDRSPYQHTFFFGYSSGAFGYLPTRQAFTEGGYEPHTCPFTGRVEEDLTKVVLSYLQGRGR